MDNKEVYLTISINYDGKLHTKKSSDFISFEDIKNISKNEFHISEEDYKYMKLRIKNDTNNETIFIENDADIIFKSTEKDENNYEITIDLTIDKNPSIQIHEEKKEKIKDEQNENNNKNNIISENIKIEKAETIDENNNNKELMDNKGDNINMSCNHNDKNLILNKDKKKEKNQKLAKYLKKLAILKYKKIINELENEINDEDNKIKDVLIKKENIIINEKIPLKKQFEICNRNNFSFKSLNIEQLKKLGEEQKNCLKLIFKDIKEKPQKFSEEMDNYNKKIQKELENYFSIVNNNFSSLIEKYKKIINNYEDNQKKIIKELQEIKKQLDDKKKEKINLAPNINIKEENGDTPFGNRNVNPNINDVLNNEIK